MNMELLRRPNKPAAEAIAPAETTGSTEIPAPFLCPISLEVMKDPVTASTGITYDRRSIETWLAMGNTSCPVTNQKLMLAPAGFELIPNHATRRTIQTWRASNRRSFATESKEDEPIQALVSHLKEPTAEKNHVNFLCPSINPKNSTIENNNQHTEIIQEWCEDEVIQALVSHLKGPTPSPKARKASLLAIYRLVSSGDRAAAARLVGAGTVPAVIEILADDSASGGSTSERALALLDSILDWPEGRREAYRHALAAPVLVKKILQVSRTATALAVSAILKLCRRYDGGDGGEDFAKGSLFLEESLGFGAFQMLVLLLQLGSYDNDDEGGATTKAKATELLKLGNELREKLGCGDTLGLKGLKKPK